MMALAKAARSMNEAFRELAFDQACMSTATVFLSYDHRNRDLARRIEALLAAYGHVVWWDARIAPGEDFADKIKSAIERAFASIVLWSAQSVQSGWVQWEANQANRFGKLIPVATAGLDLRDIMPPFNTLSTLRLGEDEKLIQALASLRARRGGTLACGMAGAPPRSQPSARSA